MISASALGRIAACPGSEHLPQVKRSSGYATLGTVLHKFMEDCTNHGMSGALERAPAEHREACALLGLESLPVKDGSQWAAEVALAFNVETFAARELGRGRGRDYSGLGSADLPMTADCIGIAESAVVVIDYKSGYAWQQPDSWQMRTLGMAAAITYDREEAYCVTLLIRPGEEPVHLTYKMDALEIAKAATEVSALVKRVKASDASKLAIGDHCRWCPALLHCPAQMTLVKSLALSAASPMTPADSAVALTPATAKEAWVKLKAAKAAIEHIDEAVRLYAERAGPLDLGGGRFLGLKEKTTESLDGGATFHALKEKYGVELADQAVEMKATKSGLEKALKPLALASGKPLSALNREAIDALKTAGAVRSKTTESVVEYKSKE